MKRRTLSESGERDCECVVKGKAGQDSASRCRGDGGRLGLNYVFG